MQRHKSISDIKKVVRENGRIKEVLYDDGLGEKWIAEEQGVEWDHFLAEYKYVLEAYESLHRSVEKDDSDGLGSAEAMRAFREEKASRGWSSYEKSERERRAPKTLGGAVILAIALFAAWWMMQ